MNEDELVEIIEDIQNNNSMLMGHNEYDLHVKLDLARYLFKNYNITEKPKCIKCGTFKIVKSNIPKKDYYCPDCSIHFNI